MFLKTFLGAMISCVISHTAYNLVSYGWLLRFDGGMHTVSKSIEVNLNSLRKNGGSRMLLLRCAMIGLSDLDFYVEKWL